MRLAVYEPDIAPNLGTMIRLCACLAIPVDVIEPCGFPFSIKAFRRAAMDYADLAEVVRHESWDAYDRQRSGRLILLTTRATTPIWDTDLRATDNLLVGRETAGVPDIVHAAADVRATIPMPGGGRSLNVAVAAGIALGEAVRQTRSS